MQCVHKALKTYTLVGSEPMSFCSRGGGNFHFKYKYINKNNYDIIF
jgi:hypothetical protein